MINEQKLEQHYQSLPSDALHIIRDEYKWNFDEFDVPNQTHLKLIEKILSLRGESLEVRVNKKILFLCKCGQSRIIQPSVPEDKIKMFIFEQYNVPCSKCKNVNMYTWKYMD